MYMIMEKSKIGITLNALLTRRNIPGCDFRRRIENYEGQMEIMKKHAVRANLIRG